MLHGGPARDMQTHYLTWRRCAYHGHKLLTTYSRPLLTHTHTHTRTHTYCLISTRTSQLYSPHDVASRLAKQKFVAFCVSRRRRKMYCGHARLCLSAAVRPHYCTDPDVTWGRGRGCPVVVHYWAALQSGHGLRCYGNITRTLVTSLRPFRDMTT